MPQTIAEQIEAGLKHHQSGRLQDAELIYRSILRNEPQNADALHLLGVVALQSGNSEAAAGLIENAIAVKPREPEFYNMCGEAYRAGRRFDVAVERYQQAIQLRPEFAGAHNNLGNAYKEMNRAEDAIASYQRAIKIDPDFPLSHNNLGLCIDGIGRPAEALTHFQEALRLLPDYAEAHANVGNALLKLGRSVEALESFERAIAIAPQLAAAHLGLGVALDSEGRPEEAAACYEKALEINPNFAAAHNNLGNALDQVGSRDAAIENFEKAVVLQPAYAEAHRNLTRIAPEAADAAAIERILSMGSLSDVDATHCHFALGNIHHHRKDFDQAFTHYSAGNGLRRRASGYDATIFTNYVDRLMDVYSESYCQTLQDGGVDSHLPVFVLGMPRSGTTLVEQIIASHPDAHGAGELKTVADFERTIATRHEQLGMYPELMPRCDRQTITELASAYVDIQHRRAPNAKRVTDKMPDNFMRIGLIKTLLPNAHIIHCERNPLDTCVSNLLHYFAAGNEFAFDQIDLGRFYQDYERLMAHWKGVFPNSMFDVRYEDLVSDQEAVSRKFIDYIELPWDDRCLDFHKHERAVHTFSSQQVRQRIYTSAVSRWKHYEKHLEPTDRNVSQCCLVCACRNRLVEH